MSKVVIRSGVRGAFFQAVRFTKMLRAGAMAGKLTFYSVTLSLKTNDARS